METGREEKEIQALVRIYIWLYSIRGHSSLSLHSYITVYTHSTSSFRAWKAGLVNEARSQAKLSSGACYSFDDTSTVTEGDCSPSPGYKRRPYWPRIAGYRIVPSPTDRHRDAYWHTVRERCSRDSEPSVLLRPWFTRLTVVTFERLSETFFGISPPLPAKKSNALVIGYMVISFLDKSTNRGTSENNGRWWHTERMDLSSIFLSGTFRVNLKFFKYSDTTLHGYLFNDRTAKVIEMINL